MDIETLLGFPSVRLSGIDLVDNQVVIHMSSMAIEASCPHCHQPSSRMHSSYTRSIADLTLCGHPVLLQVRVRRFRCPNRECQARTFAEQFPAIVAPRCRRSKRTQRVLSQLALATGGEGGARLAATLLLPASPATLRRCLRTVPLPTSKTPKYLGVDDLAWRKGQTYGTILIDLATHRPIDLLSDRSADSFAAWLKTHPGVEVISRDRASAYADGATRGAPQAEQVADRFHLLQNVREMTERVLDREIGALRVILAKRTTEPDVPLAREPTTVTAPEETNNQATRTSDARFCQRQTRFTAVHELHGQGASIHSIVHQLGISRNTVRKYLRATECPPSAARPRRPHLLDPFSTYLTRRWTDGCTNSAQLYRELKTQGFAGSKSIVKVWVSQFRQPKDTCTSQNQKRRPVSALSLSWLLVREARLLDEKEEAEIGLLREHSPVIASVYPLIQAFGTMVRERQHEQLDSWLSAAETIGQADMCAFALGLRRDLKAVSNALKLAWSNGPTEGAITRLKLIKRTGYGRASFETLRRRVLLNA